MSFETLNLVISGLVASQAVVLMIFTLRAYGKSPSAWPVAGVALGFFFYAWTPLAEALGQLPALQLTMYFEAQIPVLFWVLCESLFRDDFRLRRPHLFALLGPLASLVHVVALGVEGQAARETELMAIEAVKAIHVVCIAFGLRETLRGWSAELVNSRRTVRIAVLALSGAGLFIMIVTGFYEIDGRTLSSGPLIVVNAYVFCTLLGANAFLAFHPDLLDPAAKSASTCGASRSGAPADGVGGQDFSPARKAELPPGGSVPDVHDKVLAKLQELLSTGGVHTQEGLTLAKLASQMRVPTYRLRQVINESLGFRNFNQFLAHHRISHAKRLLGEEAWQHEKIISIALEVGYTSLAPFNKSFKDATGLTPSEYRRQACGVAADGDTPLPSS